MMEECVQHRDYRLSSLDRRGDEPRRAPRLPGTTSVSSARTFARAAQDGPLLWASPDGPLTGRVRRAETGQIAPLWAIRRILAAIRLWHARTRSRQQLSALDDHLLKDIGLKREDVGSEFPNPFWHCD